MKESQLTNMEDTGLEKDYHSAAPNEIIPTMVISGQKHLDERLMGNLTMKTLAVLP